MQIIHLESNYLIKSRLYNPNTKYNTEGLLLMYMLENKKLLFKEYYCNEKETLDNKIYTLEYLDKYRNIIDLDELIIPEYFVFLENEFKGIMMKFVRGINMENILYSPSYNIKEKMRLLKIVGLFLKKLDRINEKENINFFIGDLHEGNIIVDKNNNINIVDLDSCKIGENIPSYSKYLVSVKHKYLASLKHKDIIREKYKMNKFKNVIDQDRNTDLYCYTMIVLNTLFQGNVANLDIDDFYKYLNYLESINIDKELLDKISKIYTKEDNENIYEYLDTINDNGYKAHRNIYKIKNKKN